jgi:6-phosphogluconolactonase
VIELHSFDSPAQQAAALAEAVAGELAAFLGKAAERPVLAVSGGTSPRAFFAALSERSLDWQRVDVTLIDDRWVPEHDPASNAALVNATLLQNAAAASRFWPLVDTRLAPARQVELLNADQARRLPDLAVLGMGEDGHTASLFATAPEWTCATTTDAHFALVHPVDAPHTRITWSLRALCGIPRLFLLISGAHKLAVLQQAAAHPMNNAISKLARHEGVHLDVYWCTE